jgi:hypothetical protein
VIEDFVIPDCRGSGKSGIHARRPCRTRPLRGLWIPGSRY